MYMLSRVKDVVRVPPDKLNEPIDEIALQILNELYSGLYDKELGIIIGVYDVKVEPFGKIYPTDGSVYYEVEMSVLSYKPFNNEVVEGPVVDIKSFGIFVRIGAIDGFVHKSQLTDEYVEYDPTRPAFILKDSRKLIEIGDKVRARIIGVSVASEKEGPRIQLTMRQPYLGKIA